MSDEAKVWIRTRSRKGGKPTYHLRWIDPTANKWKSRKSGTDRKRAERDAAKLEEELNAGTYTDLRRVKWPEFIAEHVERLAGKRNRTEAERTLTEFGNETGNPEPRRVTFAMVESYAEKMKAKGNTVATVNKKLRYLRAAFNKAVRREYLARSPMLNWQWTREDDTDVRIVSPAEETALMAAAEKLYGSRMKALIQVALGTGGRRGELMALEWSRVKLDAAEVLFTATKGKRDRPVPILPETVEVLRRLMVQTQIEGGPFIGMGFQFDKRWEAIAKEAKLVDANDCPVVTLHDLRRTYITRLILAGVPLPTVQKLAGHTTIATTMTFYTKISRDDLRAGVEKLAGLASG